MIGLGENPEAQWLSTVEIAGTLHHIEATQVKGQDGEQGPVCPTEVHRYAFEVEADSPREARQKFMAMDSGEAEDAQQTGEVEGRTFEGPDPATGQVDSWDDDELAG